MMTNRLSCFLVAGLLMLLSLGATQQPKKSDGQMKPRASDAGVLPTLVRSVSVNGADYAYRVYIPEGAGDAPMPLVIFLHGSGECGTDNLAQLRVGLPLWMAKEPSKWPFIVIMPQKPTKESKWVDHDDAIQAMIGATSKEWKVDAARLYLTGLSQGGMGTWAIAAKHPTQFAAIAPVCGRGNPADAAAALEGVPIWAFHGGKDDVVKPEDGEAMIKAVQARGVNHDVKWTLFPEANHNSWDAAYGTQDLGAWFLQQRKQE